jgi:hypothetical protein
LSRYQVTRDIIVICKNEIFKILIDVNSLLLCFLKM